MSKEVEFKKLTWETLENIKVNASNNEIVFTCASGNIFKMHHIQDCCESVTIEDICGDLNDLVGSIVLNAEESTSGENPEGVKPDYQDSFTWTFYKIDTTKGSVTIRWYGDSNGYYSESVDFEQIQEEKDTKPWNNEE